MLSSTSVFVTPNASRYIAQLCKHFAHKVSVEYDETRGEAMLPSGRATMTAENGALRFEVFSETEQGLTRGKFIIEDHIVRFAFREKLEKLEWT